ncbi:hypothetical protein [Vibrio agarivorans]|uniref:Uncharacterized protein n=1 Tax=Vibrio agarivorans TaxID=153622 RepID=A0ABT7Y7J1_9VIBR|nr:hypothetical protein [Vibrio agarivorans]MDN2483963.1 hypothetical protein [Vibrio agarivorans]
MQLQSELLQFEDYKIGTGEPIVIHCDDGFIVGFKIEGKIQLVSEFQCSQLKPLMFENITDIEQHPVSEIADWLASERIGADTLTSPKYKKAHDLLKKAGLLGVNALELRA